MIDESCDWWMFLLGEVIKKMTKLWKRVKRLGKWGELRKRFKRRRKRGRCQKMDGWKTGDEVGIHERNPKKCRLATRELFIKM